MSTLRKSINNGSKQLYATSTCSNLPLELINTIFHQCNRNDLRQCALTCHSWNAAAHPILFSKIVLNSRKKFDDVISLVIKNNAIGAFVKEVDVLDMELDLRSLYLFSKIFKNIESITFDNKYYDMYKRLYELLSGGEFPSLKSIPGGKMGIYQFEIYLKCVDVIKCRMTHLDIIGAKAYVSLQQSFHTFIKLKTINIRFNDSMPMNTINLLEDIAWKNNLPSLKRIDITMAMNSFAGNMLISRMDDIQPMPNVSDLNISGYSSRTIIDDTFMCYIIKKFPNLQRLNLRSYENDKYGFRFHLPKEDNQIVLSVDVTVKFLEYVFRLSTFNVQHIVTEENTVEIIETFCSNVRKKALGDPPSYLYMYYNPKTEENEGIDAIFPVVSIFSAQPLQNLAPSIAVGLNPFYDPVFNNGQEEQKIIKHTGQYFTEIALRDAPDFSFLPVLLTDVARYCTNLKDLEIFNTLDLLEETAKWDDLVVNHSLTHLTVNSEEKCPNLLYLLSYLFAGLEMLSFSISREFYMLPKKRFDLVVPRLSVKHLLLELPAYEEFGSTLLHSNFRFFVQLDVGEKSRYLLLSVLLHTKSKTRYDEYPIKFDKEITASEFEESKKNDQNYYIYHMQCKSTEKVSIKYPAEEKIKLDSWNSFVYRIYEVNF